MREFAEQEIIIPDGPFGGTKFSCDRQPHTRLWFDEVDSGRWRRHATTGPVQGGKSLLAFIIPACYHLFERRETIILGLPRMEMARDKWTLDLEPVIQASRYRDMIPTRGTGSRGGSFESIRFRNGATLKFMSGGGGDKNRASFTSRVLIVTEADGLDESGGASREADPLRQMEARTASWGDKARIYLECTVSIEKGRIWQEIQNGTNSRIALCCPICHGYVTPERDSLVGWQGAPDEIAAAERSAFHCDLCGAIWTETQRRQAHALAKLVHKGQEIDKTGTITGDLPRTYTFGYRFTAANNFLRTANFIGGLEWKAANSEDQDGAEKEMCQWVWAKPPKPTVQALANLDARAIATKMAHPGRGYVPEDAEIITLGADLHNWHIEWVAVAWREGCKGHILDYGVEPVPSDAMAVELAILTTLRSLRSTWLAGWQCSNKGPRFSRVGLFDSGYLPEVAYRFCTESGSGFLPSKGQGATQRAGAYNKPKQLSKTILHIGDEWHVATVPRAEGGAIELVEINVDHWKTWLHERWRSKPGTVGAMELFHSSKADEHIAFARHQTSEEKQVEFIQGRGEVVKWVKKQSANHWFDALTLACVAASIAGVKLVDPDQPKPAANSRPPDKNGPHKLFQIPGDDRPFLVTDR